MSDGVSEHHFTLKHLLGDYARSVAGVGLTGAPLALLPFDPVATPLLGALVVLFAGYGVRTVRRHRTLVLVGPDGLTVAMRGSRRPRWSARWHGLDRVRLAIYARRRRGGLTELTILFGKRRLKVDSEISDFVGLARRIFEQAEKLQLPLSAATRSNFAALDVTADSADDDRSTWGRPSEWRDRPELHRRNRDPI